MELIAGRLTSIASFEKAKSAREEARNLLEGYLYRLKAYLDPESEHKALHEFSTSSEKAALTQGLESAFEWLNEHAEGAAEKELRSKRTTLE